MAGLCSHPFIWHVGNNSDRWQSNGKEKPSIAARRLLFAPNKMLENWLPALLCYWSASFSLFPFDASLRSKPRVSILLALCHLSLLKQAAVKAERNMDTGEKNIAVVDYCRVSFSLTCHRWASVLSCLGVKYWLYWEHTAILDAAAF